MSHAPVPTPSIDPELKTLLRRVKLGRCLDTLPERLALARAEHLPHAEFLQLVLADEVDRRDRASAELRARAAKLDPTMRLETFQPDTGVRFDRQLWHELCSLRFLDDARGACVLGPVGVGKTHLATALGHIAIRRRRTVLFARADQLFRRLKAARLDNTVEAEMRRLARVDLLILDDLALQAMDPTETADFYELVVERHQKIVHCGHEQPRPFGVDRADERPAARPVRDRPARGHQLRAHHRGRVLPPPPAPRPHPPTRRNRRVLIDPTRRTNDHHIHPQVVPEVVATRWSHPAGKRHSVDRQLPDLRKQHNRRSQRRSSAQFRPAQVT